jgi:two-component system cell cycle response regulator DivK
MDIQLPGISGIEAFRQLRADPVTRAIPVIAVTASVMAQERQKVMRPASTGSRASPSACASYWRRFEAFSTSQRM